MALKRSILKVGLSSIVALLLVLCLWWLSTERVGHKYEPETSPNAAKPVPDFTDYENLSEKKRAFFSYLKPEVETQNEYLLNLRHQLLLLQRQVEAKRLLADKDYEKLQWLAEEYRVKVEITPTAFAALAKVITELLNKIDVIPAELVLVQAANESAWGTSRFARQGYNFFGLWCFRKGCGFVPSRRGEGANHEVAKFSNLTRAVYTYMLNLNRHEAYGELRRIRAHLRENNREISADALAEGLVNYSERGYAYVEELQAMIRFNQEFFSE